MLHTLVSIHYTIYVWTYTNIHAHIHNTYTDIIYDTYIKYINYIYIYYKNSKRRYSSAQTLLECELFIQTVRLVVTQHGVSCN